MEGISIGIIAVTLTILIAVAVYITIAAVTAAAAATVSSAASYCCKPPRNVLYKCTFGVPDQGQMLDM